MAYGLIFCSKSADMWQQITTLSEIDTISAGTFVAKENPDENIDTDIYRVMGKTATEISINLKVSDDPAESLVMPSDDLFDKRWWMMKEA